MPVRWAGEQVVETVPVQVTKELEVKEVHLVDEILRSPGGSKPMQRKFKYQSTPEAAEVDPEYAEEVHEKNLLEHGRVIKDFDMTLGAVQRPLWKASFFAKWQAEMAGIPLYLCSAG